MKQFFKRFGIAVFFFIICMPTYLSASELKFTLVQTPAPNNKEVKVYYRIPAGYSPTRKEAYRVLVYFGGLNDDPVSLRHMEGEDTWGEWADENKIFLVFPYFRNDDYWNPASWSGQALMAGLANIKKGHNICTSKIFYYGYSRGAVAANLFAAWRPDVTRAWASHMSFFFHSPGPQMRGVPGLVTCGDADAYAYLMSRNFIERCRLSKNDVIWKSYYNLPHKVNVESRKLACGFFKFYHLKNISDLNTRTPERYTSAKTQFIGDDLSGKFFPVNSPGAKNIPLEDQVSLPSEELAELWAAAAG